MGFTHYWYQPKELNKDKFAEASKDCKLIADKLKIPIQFGRDSAEPALFSDSKIRFNGVGEDGHETFLVSQVFSHHFLKTYSPDEDGRYFSFCKTARKDYDTVVVACLVILKHYLGDDFKVSSDGDSDDWQEGLQAVREHLKYGQMPFVKD